MNINTKILDRYDRQMNIYQLILKLAERAHQLLEGATGLVEIGNTDPSSPRLVMEEFLFKSEHLSEVTKETSPDNQSLTSLTEKNEKF
ncbi:MAG: hypothetical protein NC911_06505 [Candidatus Omnitrophica bacterium]|nr:hypothetical protein [Candidatus Omnitrophota bacterium]